MIDPNKQSAVTSKEQEEQERHEAILIAELKELLDDKEEYKW